MNYTSVIISLVLLTICVSAKECPNIKSNSKLFCYYGKITDIDTCQCSHVILPANSDVKSIDRVRDQAKGVKILVTVNEFNEGLVNLLKKSKVDGLEINLKKLSSKEDINDFISTIKSKLGSDLHIAVSVPAKSETLAKYFDFKTLSRNADWFILQTSFLGASQNVTFHPSRLSGLWDMQNTDSVVDLVTGLGAPLSKLIITAPVQGYQFTLQSEEHTAPGSPAIEVKSLTRDELCKVMKSDNWTLERDQDQAGPYIFRDDKWVAFDDTTSIDIKAKYVRVRGLAGMALKDLSQDGGKKCGPTLLESAYLGLSKQARAPRGAVLHSLEREILESSARQLDSIQVSPYRITRVIDVEGQVHSIRQDTRTEFACSRQGYFVHPRSCNRFYRCVKFDQTSDEFNVFEFDCPAGLAFDEKVEVCVWPGSLSHASACSGSSEIAPVPRERFVCPSEPGYYADPENCRWFFACLDHGRSNLEAYEFRCPFGLVFDQDKLLCEWSWIVPKCASGLYLGNVEYHGGQAFSLDAYQGLGSLNAVKLGGLSGPLQQAEAKIYSNVGVSNLGVASAQNLNSLNGASLLGVSTSADGVSFGHNLDSLNGGALVGIGGGFGTAQNLNTLNRGALLHQNSAQYIDQNTFDASRRLGLSLQSTNSLQNAGLLKLGSAGSYIQTGIAGHGDLTSGSYIQNGLTENRIASAGHYNTLLNGNLNQHGISNIIEHYNSLGSSYGNYGGGIGYETNVNLNNLQGFGGNVAYSNVNLGTNPYVYRNGLDVDQNRYSSENNFGLKTGQYASSYNQQYGGLNLGINNANSHQIIGIGDERIRGQSFNALNLDKEEQLSRGVAGNINIVGGGFSGIGTTSNGAGLRYDTNNIGLGIVSSVSPTPISISSANVPVVTHVPIPAVNTATNFESYNGGVVANLPELQLRIDSPSVINGFANFTGGYAASTVPSVSFVKDSNLRPNLQAVDGYQVSVTARPAIQPDLTNIYSKTNVGGGYYYEKPGVIFEENPQVLIQQTKTVLPNVAQKIVQPVIQPVVSSYSFTNQANGGYNYVKPVVAVARNPQLLVSSTPSSLYEQVVLRPNLQPVDGYQVSVTARPSIQPDLTNIHSNTNVGGGYYYEKPGVIFEEKPQVLIQQTKTIAQKIVQPVIQPAVSSYSFTNQANEGYDYVKPVVAVSRNPQFLVSSTPSSLLQQEVLVQPQTVNSGSSFSYSNQDAALGYNYERPSVRFEERPKVQLQQSIPLQETKIVTNQQPATVISSYTSNSEYQYNTPTPQVLSPQRQNIFVSSTPVPFVQQTIVQPLVQEPAAVSSYSVTNQNSDYGYKINKPIVVENRPQVLVHQPSVLVQPTPATIVSQHVTQPSTFSFTNQQSNTDYTYEAPSIAFKEESKVLVQPPSVFVSSTPSTIVSQNYAKSSGFSFSNQENNFGYQYEKPSFVFEEKPKVLVQQPSVFVTSSPRPFVTQNVVKPAVVSSYSFAEPGYDYKQPSVIYQQKPDVIGYERSRVPFIEQPSVLVQPQIQISSTPTPIYRQPAISSFSIDTNTVQQAVVQPVQKTFTGYQYEKPSVVFEEKPAIKVQPSIQPEIISTYSYRPVAPQQPLAVSSYNYKDVALNSVTQSYSYPKPEVRFEEKPLVRTPAVVSSYTYSAPSTPRPLLVSSTLEPIVQQNVVNIQPEYKVQQPSIVSSYTFPERSTVRPVVFSQAVQPIVKQSFLELEPEYKVQQATFPISSTPRPFVYTNLQTVNPTVQRNFVEAVQQPAYQVQRASVVPTLNFAEISTPTPIVYTNTQTVKPIVKQDFVNIVQQPAYKVQQPSVISSFSFPEISTPRPFVYTNTQTVKPIVQQQNFVDIVQQPAFKVQQPSVVSTFDFPAPTLKPFVQQNYVKTIVEQPVYKEKTVEFRGYDYPKPQYQFVEESKPILTTYENREPVKEEIIVPKKAYVTGYQQNVEGYNYDKPAIEFEERPTVVEDYKSPTFDLRFSQDDRIVTTSTPLVTSTLAPVQPTGREFYIYDSRLAPTVRPSTEEYYLKDTTPRPTFTSTVASIVAQKVQPIRNEIYSYERSSTVQPLPVLDVSTSRPISRYSFSALDSQYQQQNQQVYNEIQENVAQPDVYLPEEEAVVPIVQNEYIPVVSTTTERVRTRTRFRPEPLREYLPVTTEYPTTIPTAEYLPVRTKATNQYVRITTPRPSTIYLPSRVVSTTVPTPSKEYLPVRNSLRVTTEPSREYLPGKSMPIYVENYENFKLSRKPAKVIKIVRPVAKTIVKQNDFHPLLAAKLGAQCTCVSDTLNLRKQQRLKIEIPEYDDNQEVEAEDNEEEVVEINRSPIIVENFEYDPEKIVAITPTPEVYITSTSNTLEPQVVAVRKQRVRGRLQSSRNTADDIFVRRKVTLVSKQTDDDEPSDREIAKAVRTGLKLVKQAAKEGAKEGTREVLSGSARVRGRITQEIDCQRAGLFRHPTQCNKFYACRWDCDKNRFTLHVFNCPVHLTFDNSLGACNWPSQGPACLENTLLPSE